MRGGRCSQVWASVKAFGNVVKMDNANLTRKEKLSLLAALLAVADDKTARSSRLPDVVQLARDIVGAVDVDALTKCVGQNPPLG